MRSERQAKWLPIPDHQDYQISTDGQVTYKGRVVQGSVDQRGYRVVSLHHRPTRVHKLVMLTFVGPRPEGLEIRHLNDIKQDNRLENLAYGTRSENQRDRVTNGIHPRSLLTHCSAGHEFTDENTKKVKRSGVIRRACRQCANETSRRYRERQA